VTPTGLLVVAATTILPVGAVSAHSVLISMDPADGSLVLRPITQVVLKFDSPIQDLGDVVVVLAPSGAHLENGHPAVIDDVVTQQVKPVTEPGHYTIEYRVTSTDGHPVSRRLGFDYLTRSTPTATTSSRPMTGRSASGMPIWGVLAGVGLLGVVLAISAIWLARRRRHPRSSQPAA